MCSVSTGKLEEKKENKSTFPTSFCFWPTASWSHVRVVIGPAPRRGGGLSVHCHVTVGGLYAESAYTCYKERLDIFQIHNDPRRQGAFQRQPVFVAFCRGCRHLFSTHGCFHGKWLIRSLYSGMFESVTIHFCKRK